MGYRATSPGRDRTAIGISIAIHCCVLASLVFVPQPAFSPDIADERVLLTSIIHIEHRPAPKPPRHRVLPPAPLAIPVADRTALHVARADAHASRAMIVASERQFDPHPEVIKQTRSVVVPAPVAVETEAPAAVVTAAASTQTPSPTPTASPVAVAHEAGIGNFGEDYPAKVDPQARGALFAGITDAVQLKVSVDESGHAVAVEFMRPPSDPALLQELRSRLMAARFIPAVCNGLRCAGTVPLHN